jgi:hypothetical protein
VKQPTFLLLWIAALDCAFGHSASLHPTKQVEDVQLPRPRRIACAGHFHRHRSSVFQGLKLIYTKSILAGLAAVIIVVVVLFAGFYFATYNGGVYGIGATSVGISASGLLAGILIVFAAGAFWFFRRASK